METVGAISAGTCEQEGKNENHISIHILPLVAICFLILVKMVVCVGVAGSWGADGAAAAGAGSAGAAGLRQLVNAKGIKPLQNRTTKRWHSMFECFPQPFASTNFPKEWPMIPFTAGRTRTRYIIHHSLPIITHFLSPRNAPEVSYNSLDGFFGVSALHKGRTLKNSMPLCPGKNATGRHVWNTPNPAPLFAVLH